MVAIPVGSGIMDHMKTNKGTTMSSTSKPAMELASYVKRRIMAKGYNLQDAHSYMTGYLETMLEEACRLSPKVRKEVQSHLQFLKDEAKG
jgi:hypothetical protein